jgi:hypothetical protein
VLRIPKITSKFSGFARRTHKTQQIVVFTDKIETGKQTQQDQQREQKHGAKVQGKLGTSF